MKKPDKERLEAARDELVRLIKTCPRGAARLKDCPFPENISLPSSDKSEWLKSLSDVDLQEISLSYCQCVKNKAY